LSIVLYICLGIVGRRRERRRKRKRVSEMRTSQQEKAKESTEIKKERG